MLNRAAKTVIFSKSPQLISNCPAWLRNFKLWSNVEKSVHLQTIHEGAVGTVYLAQSLDDRNKCAMKIYSKAMLRSQAGIKAKVQREWAVHSSLSHPNIIEAYVGFEDKRWVGIAMEYAGEHNTIKWLESQGREAMSESEVKAVAFDMLSALDYLHSQGIVHRDVKSENIYRTAEGGWKLGDFGSAVEVEALEEGQPLQPEGTLSYSAPEYLSLWSKVTWSAVRAVTAPPLDIWSMGATTYDLLTGGPPFQTEDSTDQQELQAALTAEPPYPSTLSAAAVDFVSAALRKEPSQRPTAEQLLQHPWLSS